MVKKHNRKNPFQVLMKILLCIVLTAGLFTGGRALGQGIASGAIEFQSFSFSSLASLPVFSMFFDEEHQEKKQAESLQNMQEVEDEEGEAIIDGEAINILMMGIDARNPKENSRSDTMILLSVDAKNKQVAMISIPRDTKIKTSGGRVEKLNAVNAVEGPEGTCRVIGRLLNTNIDHYVVVNFQGFINVVDILGGVDLYVDMNMFHADNQTPELEIELFEGQQHLNGKQALQYVRYRGGQTADIGRTQRQQKFLKAMADKMFSIGIVPKIPSLWSEVKNSIRTDLTVSDIGSLVKVASALQDAEIYTQTVPGKPGWSGGASYWIADESVLPTLVSDVRSGKTIDVAGDPQGVGSTRGSSFSSGAGTSSKPEKEEEKLDNGQAGDDTVQDDESSGLGDLTDPLPPADEESDKKDDGSSEEESQENSGQEQEEFENIEEKDDFIDNLEAGDTIVTDDFWIEEGEDSSGAGMSGGEMESPLGDLEGPLAPQGDL